MIFSSIIWASRLGLGGVYQLIFIYDYVPFLIFVCYKQLSFPRYGLYLVGSTMNGFGSDKSDVDMCLHVRHTEMDQRNEAVGHLEQMLKCLRGCGESS